MTQDTFLKQYFNSTDTVTVNALELQNLIRELQSAKRINKSKQDRIETLEMLLELAKNNKGHYVDLKG